MTTGPTGTRPSAGRGAQSGNQGGSQGTPHGGPQGTSQGASTRPPPLPSDAQSIAQAMTQAMGQSMSQSRSPSKGPPSGPPKGNAPSPIAATLAGILKSPAGSRLVRHVWNVLRAVVYVAVPVSLLSLIALGIMYVRLRHGPVAFDILVPPIERSINAELVGNSVDIKGAELRLSDSGELEFRITNVNILEADGDIVATAPMAAISVSKPALWRARIVPEKIELIDPVINLVFTDEHGLALSVSDSVADAAAPEKADGRLGEPPTDGLKVPAPQPAKRPAAGAERTSTQVKTTKQLNLVKMLSEASQRARRKQGATSYLTEFGIKNASVVLEYSGQRSAWTVTEASVDFNHAKRRSIISGRAYVSSERGPWAITFLTDESERSDRLQIKATVRDLMPSSLAAAAPPLALLKMLDMPIAGDATIEVSREGEIEKADIALEVSSGRIVHPDLTQPFNVTAGLFRLGFDGKERRWDLQPSPIKWADGNMLFTGSLRDTATENSPPVWRFDLSGKNGVIEATEFNVPPVTLDTFTATGAIVPRRGLVEVSELHIAGGGGDFVMKARTHAGPAGQSTTAEVALSPMPLDTLKALWPRVVAHGARSWVGERVTAATFHGGTVKYVNGEYLTAPEAGDTAGKTERLTASFEITDATFLPLPGMAPVTSPRTLVQLADNGLEITIPEAFIALPGARKVPIKQARVTSPDVMIERPDAEISFASQSPLGPFLEAIETMPIKAVQEAAPFPKAGEGKVDAQFKIKLPLIAELKSEDAVIEGKARISDGRFGKVGGQFDVQGFTLALDLTETTLDAKGDLLVNSVPAKISGQRIFGADADKQPPMKITANLDETDRNQLGLDVNDIIHGVLPVEISLQKSTRPEPVVRLKADLTNTELEIEAIAYKKDRGRPAFLETDVVTGKTHKTELQNFKVSGDDIAIEGWIGVAADGRAREIHFPTFSVNVVSRLEVQGTLGNDNIWNIKAKGQNFDGRDLFKSLFSMGDKPEQKAKSAKASAGTDLWAEIDNVFGYADTRMRGVKLKLSSRSEKLTALDGKGTLDNGANIAAALEKGNGRRLLVDSTDAGQVMRLIDFYPNMQGGRLRLEVNLDGKGAAEKTGILWVDDFKVLGDPVVSEVVGSADQGRPAIGNKKVTRETFQFERLRAPFSVGYGQFVLEESYMKGPMMGANMRGKVDYKLRKVNIGGTYIPLQGLNAALGDIPLLGQILSGAHGEGIFGITFAVQGSMSDPQVLVNPLSLVTPGILRGLMEMTPYNPKVQVREDRAPSKPVEERVRASSAPASQATGSKRKATTASEPSIVDGWTSTTSPPKSN